MTSIPLDLPRRFPWPGVLSVVLHGAVVAGLLVTPVHQVVDMPAPAQPISIMMVAPVAPEPPKPEVVQPPEPAADPEPESPAEPPEKAPVVIHKPKPKPKPKPVKKAEQPKRQEMPVEPRPSLPVENATPVRAALAAPVAAVASVNNGPRALSRNQPQYPSRAYALHMEGRVRVKFDVDGDGGVSNVTILAAQPANMFEREVKQAMRKWRYEAGKPGQGLIVNIVFRINGGARME